MTETPMKSDINTNVRLFDLVRFMRSELHEAELITDREYGWLCAEAPVAKGQGSPSPRRLENYDDIRARMKLMEAALNEVIKAAPAGGPLWHGSAQIEAARRALDSGNAMTDTPPPRPMNTENTPTHAPDSDLPVASAVGKTLMRDANHDLLGIPLSKCEDVEALRTAADALWSLLDDIDTACDMFKPTDEAGYRKFYVYTMRKVGLRQAILTSDGYDLFLPSPTPQDQ